jgi:hypothetical protein
LGGFRVFSGFAEKVVTRKRTRKVAILGREPCAETAAKAVDVSRIGASVPPVMTTQTIGRLTYRIHELTMTR